MVAAVLHLEKRAGVAGDAVDGMQRGLSSPP